MKRIYVIPLILLGCTPYKITSDYSSDTGANEVIHSDGTNCEIDPFGEELTTFELTFSDPTEKALFEAPSSCEDPVKVNADLTISNAREVCQYENIQLRKKGDTTCAYNVLSNKPSIKIHFAEGDSLSGLENITLENNMMDASGLSYILASNFFNNFGAKYNSYIVGPKSGSAIFVYEGHKYSTPSTVIEPVTTKSFLESAFNVDFDEENMVLYDGLVDFNSSKLEFLYVCNEGRCDAAPLDALLEIASSEENYSTKLDRLSRYLALPTILSYMAAEISINHWDGYISNNNYGLFYMGSDVSYIGETPYDKFYFIPSGLDLTFNESYAETTSPNMAMNYLTQLCLSSQDCMNLYANTLNQTADLFEQTVENDYNNHLNVLSENFDLPSYALYNRELFIHNQPDRLRHYAAQLRSGFSP